MYTYSITRLHECQYVCRTSMSTLPTCTNTTMYSGTESASYWFWPMYYLQPHSHSSTFQSKKNKPLRCVPLLGWSQSSFHRPVEYVNARIQAVSYHLYSLLLIGKHRRHNMKTSPQDSKLPTFNPLTALSKPRTTWWEHQLKDGFIASQGKLEVSRNRWRAM